MLDESGIVVNDGEFPITTDTSFIDAGVIGTSEGPTQYSQGSVQLSGTFQALCNESSLVDPLTDNSIDLNFYLGAETLLNRPLVLDKDLESPTDIRYKTDYFPRTGPNADKSQAPRYLHTADGEQEITIKFSEGFIPPPNPSDYLLECTLLTVSTLNEYHLNANKFQLNHTDPSVMDQNPFFVMLTEEHFKEGEVRVKLVLIKEKQSELKKITSLPLFNNSDKGIICSSFKDLKETYQLNRASIAFSLGYFDSDNRFIRFPYTTAISNEIIEKDKAETKDNIICPNCSHRFSIKKQEKKNRKRSPSSSKSNKKVLQHLVSNEV